MSRGEYKEASSCTVMDAVVRSLVLQGIDILQLAAQAFFVLKLSTT